MFLHGGHDNEFNLKKKKKKKNKSKNKNVDIKFSDGSVFLE